MRKREILIVVLLTVCLPAVAAAQTLLTGEVYSRQAQDIIVPLTTDWKASISMMVEEGEPVQPGDVVVEFDGTRAALQLEQQRETVRAEEAKTARDLAQLDKEFIQADYAVKLARVELEMAKMRAEIPRGVIGALDYAENQLAADKARKALQDAQSVLVDKTKLLAERQERAELDRQKAQLTEAWWSEMLKTFTVEADQPGYVIHGVHPWNRSKFQVGDTVQTSFQVAQVADTSDLAIRVWVNSVDRPRIESGAAVQIIFDALPDRVLAGRLDSLSESGAKRSEWGEAVYYEGSVTFDASQAPELLPGMSALVEVL
jgi:multidrug resistance efflux pump